MSSKVATTDKGLDVLIVEDDADTAEAMQRIVERAGFTADNVQRLADAFDRVGRQAPAILLLDLSLPDGDGLDAIARLSASGKTRVIVISGTDDAERTRKCLQAGVFDFLVKPAVARDLVFAVRRADSHRRKGLVATTSYPPKLTLGFGALGGTSRASLDLIAQVRNAAKASPAHALITGQPGVMKADIAALLHQHSQRKGSAYIVSCASETGQKALDRFFGNHHSLQDSVGKDTESYLMKANGGTLVLDDVSSLPIDIQQRLEAFMTTGTVLPHNALTPQACDCTLIGILREPAETALAAERLYDPFFFTLARNTVKVPPLVERKDDIELFARTAVEQLNQVFDTEKSLSEGLLDQLRAHYWPGNLMELKNTMLTAYRLTEAGDEIAADESLFVENEAGVSDQIAPFVGKTFSEVEKQLITATLEACDNNKSQAARVLGISLKTLYNRLNSYEKAAVAAAEQSVDA